MRRGGGRSGAGRLCHRYASDLVSSSPCACSRRRGHVVRESREAGSEASTPPDAGVVRHHAVVAAVRPSSSNPRTGGAAAPYRWFSRRTATSTTGFPHPDVAAEALHGIKLPELEKNWSQVFAPACGASASIRSVHRAGWCARPRPRDAAELSSYILHSCGGHGQRLAGGRSPVAAV